MDREEGLVELLDGPLDRATLAANLRDLARVNRWLGGTDLSWRALEHLRRWLPSADVAVVVDVGTGAADIPRALVKRARRARLRLRVEATDVRPEVVSAARDRTGDIDEISVSLVAPDSLPWPDQSVDVAHASLVLHHLERPQAERLLSEMARVARAGVIVNDLMRARRWWLGAWLLGRIFTRNRYTRHDAPLSVRRAYQPAEIVAMAERVGLREEATFHDVLGHRYAIVLCRRAT